MLDERKAAILRAVVEEYIETAQPVGSGHVAVAPGVNVSSATVRNDMAQLEHDGYLRQPHTSAGRVPTEKGYRFFVDTLTGPAPLARPQDQQVRTFFARAHGELEQMLQDTSRLLSDLTDYAAVVISPTADDASIRGLQLVGLAPRVALNVLVLSTGGIEKHTIEFNEAISEPVLTGASAHLAHHLTGVARSSLPASVPSSGDAVLDQVVEAVLATLATGIGVEADADHVFVGGAARMAAAFDAVETVQQVLTILEQQFMVVTLIRDVLDRGLHVAIGSETGLVPLADCALVVAPYDVEGGRAGSIGVLGPTRMNYSQAMAAVAVVSRRLGRRLSEG